MGDVYDKLVKFVASGCLSGYAPIAPGTAGSALAALIYWFGPELSGLDWFIVLPVFYLVAGAISFDAERIWGKDAGHIVIDEMIGFYVSVAFLPKTLPVVLAAFFLFRAADIVKPPPARPSERLPGGWGVVTDDVVAGVYANLLIRIGMAVLKAM